MLSSVIVNAQPVQSYAEAKKYGDAKLKALKMENVAHSMRYEVVKKSNSIQKLIQSPFTIYEIKDSYDLHSQTIVIPNHCVLVFNGGSLRNGKVVANDAKFCVKNNSPAFFDCEIDGAIEKIAYVVKACDAGMVKNSEKQEKYNYEKLRNIIAEGKNLYLDGKYYVSFSEQITLDRTLSVFGGELVYRKNAFGFSNGGGIIVLGSTISVSDKKTDSFFCGSKRKLGAVIVSNIEFKDCVINCKYLVNIRYEDMNSDLLPFGVKRVVYDHCVLTESGRCRIIDAVISEKCSFTYNDYRKVTTTPIYICCQHSAQASPNDKTAYQFVAQNLPKGCPILIDHNIFSGIPRAAKSYYCSALIKSVDCLFTNNYIQDIINYSNDSSATAYDAYLSCVNVYYENNYVKDVMSFSKGNTKKPQCQIGKSKTNPLSFIKKTSRRIYKNNVFTVDGNRLLQMGADSSSLYSEIFGNYSYIDEYIWDRNAVIFKKAKLKTGKAEKGYGVFELTNNYFEVEEMTGSGLVSFRSDLKMNQILIQKNTFKVEKKQLLPLVNQRFKEAYKRVDQKIICVTDNTFVNSFPRIVVFTGENVVVRKNVCENGVITGDVYLSKVNGAGPTVDVKQMDVDMQFGKIIENTGGLFQYFSSNSNGKYSFDLEQVPQKGVHFIYKIDNNHNFCISLSIDKGNTDYEIRIPFCYKDGTLQYEWEGEVRDVVLGKSNTIVWYKSSGVQLKTIFYPNNKNQIVTCIYPFDNYHSPIRYRFSFLAE